MAYRNGVDGNSLAKPILDGVKEEFANIRKEIKKEAENIMDGQVIRIKGVPVATDDVFNKAIKDLDASADKYKTKMQKVISDVNNGFKPVSSKGLVNRYNKSVFSEIAESVVLSDSEIKEIEKQAQKQIVKLQSETSNDYNKRLSAKKTELTQQLRDKKFELAAIPVVKDFEYTSDKSEKEIKDHILLLGDLIQARQRLGDQKEVNIGFNLSTRQKNVKDELLNLISLSDKYVESQKEIAKQELVKRSGANISNLGVSNSSPTATSTDVKNQEKLVDEADLWQQSAAKTKEEYKNADKYLLSAEDTVKRINELWKKNGGNKVWDKDFQEWKPKASINERAELLSQMSRLEQLRNAGLTDADLSDLQKRYFTENKKSFVNDVNDANKYTSYQIKAYQEIREEAEKAAEATKKVDEWGGNSSGNASVESIEVITNGLAEISTKLDNVVTDVSNVNEAISRIGDSDAISKLNEQLEDVQTNIGNIKQQLTVQDAKSYLNNLGIDLSNSSDDEIIKMAKGNKAYGSALNQLQYVSTIDDFFELFKKSDAYKNNDIGNEKEWAIIVDKFGKSVDQFTGENGHVKIPNEGVDNLLHTHAYNDSIDYLRFSPDDIKTLVGKVNDRIALICGNEIEEINLTKVPQNQRQSLSDAMVSLWNGVYLSLGAQIDEVTGQIKADDLPPEIQNRATELINSMLQGILSKYGATLSFGIKDGTDVDGFIENTFTRTRGVKESEYNKIQQYRNIADNHDLNISETISAVSKLNKQYEETANTLEDVAQAEKKVTDYSPTTPNESPISSAQEQSKVTSELEESAQAQNQVVENAKEYASILDTVLNRVSRLKDLQDAGVPISGTVPRTLITMQQDKYDYLKSENFGQDDASKMGVSLYQVIDGWVHSITSEMVKALGISEEELVARIHDIQNAVGGAFKSNGSDSAWNHFATYTNGQKDVMSKNNGITYKVYASFENIEDLNKDIVSSIMKELSEAGFKGRLKTTTGATSSGDYYKLHGLAMTDQMVIHGATQNDQKIAYDVLKKMGLNLSYLGGGIDTPDGSFSETIEKGTIQKYIGYLEDEKQAIDKVNQSQQNLNETMREQHSPTPNETAVSTPEIEKETNAFTEQRQEIEKLTEAKNEEAKISEIVKRISNDSSIREIKTYEDISMEAAKVTEKISHMYDDGITDTEEYIALQYKFFKLLEECEKRDGGFRSQGFNNKREHRNAIQKSWEEDTNGLFNRKGSWIDALYDEKNISRSVVDWFGNTNSTRPMKSVVKSMLDDGVNFNKFANSNQQTLANLERENTELVEHAEALNKDTQAEEENIASKQKSQKYKVASIENTPKIASNNIENIQREEAATTALTEATDKLIDKKKEESSIDDNQSFSTSFETEKAKVDEVVESEKSKFDELKSKLDDTIPKAINEKNEAFTKEQNHVHDVVEAEKGYLDELKGKIKEISDNANIDLNINNNIDNSSYTTPSTGRVIEADSKNKRKYERKAVHDDDIAKNDELARKRAEAVERVGKETTAAIEQADNSVIKAATQFYDSQDRLVKMQIKSIENTEEGLRQVTTTINYNKKQNMAFASDIYSWNYDVSEITKVEDAFESLINTEERYQKLATKQDVGLLLSPAEIGNLESLNIEREKANEVIKQQGTLTEAQQKIEDKWIQKQQEAKRVAEAQTLALMEQAETAEKLAKAKADKKAQKASEREAKSNESKVSSKGKEVDEISDAYDRLAKNIKLVNDLENKAKTSKNGKLNAKDQGNYDVAKNQIAIDEQTIKNATNLTEKQTEAMNRYNTVLAENKIRNEATNKVLQEQAELSVKAEKAQKQSSEIGASTFWAKNIANKTDGLDLTKATDEFRDKMIKARQELADCVQYMEKLQADEPITQEQLDRTKAAVAQVKQLNSDWNNPLKGSKAASENQFSKLYKNAVEYKTKITGASKGIRDELDDLIARIEKMGRVGSTTDLSKLGTELNDFESKVKAAGQETKSFFDMFTSRVKGMSASALAQYFSLYDIIRYAREGFQTINDLDTALVDLKKTTTMNADELNKFYFSANKTAVQMGVTTKEIINQASAWSRLGLGFIPQTPYMVTYR